MWEQIMNQRKQLLIQVQATYNSLLVQKNELTHHQNQIKSFLYNYRYILTLTALLALIISKKIPRPLPTLFNKTWEVFLFLANSNLLGKLKDLHGH